MTEPQATFSSCFGAVFLVWHPTKYAEMLGKLIDEHGSHVWLVNTGWSGGPYGVGKRMKLRLHPRHGARGARRRRSTTPTTAPTRSSASPIPTAVPDVPTEVLDPRNTWTRRAPPTTRRRRSWPRCSAKNFEKFGSVATNDPDGGTEGLKD